MSKPNNTTAPQKGNSGKWFSVLAIPILFVIAELIFHLVLGNGANFEGGDNSKHPVTEGFRSYLGLVYKGGPIVPFLFTAFLTTLAFSIERFWTLSVANGKGSVPDFVRKIQSFLAADNVDSAIAECDKQRGSVANVVKSGLEKYKEMSTERDMTKDQKIIAIQTEIEEAKSLEMPMLEKNLPILSTIASVGTLIALLGTVIGMIKAFKALASSGAPDAVALSTGISEALINTALGIGTSAISIILYNYFTARIDAMKYNIDEAGFSMTQTFAAHNK